MVTRFCILPVGLDAWERRRHDLGFGGVQSGALAVLLGGDGGADDHADCQGDSYSGVTKSKSATIRIIGK